ncbi:MAG: protein-export rane protein SecF [Clostridia bacterium]|jgi:preprotein translocase SecF subunit|nr:protein-export rane protein SecF [Clostridia bacterium]
MKIYDFMKYRKTWFGLSIAILLLGLIFSFIVGGLNYGIDFTGGTSITAEIPKAFTVEEIRAIADKFDKEAIVTYGGANKELAMIKTKIYLNHDQQVAVYNDFKEMFGIEQTNVQFESIGPVIGNELKRQAVMALLFAIIGILLYISLRFEWKFGLAAVLALVHDVGIMLVVYTVLQIPVNVTFIAAILTIVGYSINDTIVVFDRVRENLKNNKKITDIELVNQSTSSTIARSINTSFTTLLTIVALYVFGVPAIKDFALPLIVGVVAGTYSSIFIASPLWVILRKKFNPAASR